MPTTWPTHIVDLSRSVVPDIPRIRTILDQLGIQNADYEDPDDYVPSAFVNAEEAGKALAFQAALVRSGLITGGRRRGPVDVEGELFGRLATLQAFSSPVYRPTDARVAARRMLLASDLVCRVDVDDSHGTGMLVAPALVATAAHVVQDLVDASGAKPVALAGSTSRIRVTFGDVADLLEDQDRPTRLAGTEASLAEDWLAYYSPPTPQEIAGNGFVLDSVDGIDERGPWDLAILRLAAPRNFRPMPSREQIPRRPFQVHVLHHPDDGTGKGLPMLWSIGRIDRPLGDPPVRLLHSANTSRGSSGAPVFDADFRIVGLHQAGMPPAPSHEDEACNRAVPALRWASMLASLELPDAVPLVAAVETIGDDGVRVIRTVIGRQETLARIWLSRLTTASPAERLVAVLGEPGLGLRFTKYLVHALVTMVGGAYASIDVANCQNDDAETFAGKVAGAFAAPSGRRTPSGLTTVQREVRNRTAPALAAKLNAVAGERGAWLVLEGFESTAPRPSAAVVDLVRQLIQELPHAPGVRLVLAGWQESLPAGFEASAEYLVEPSADDIARTLLPPEKASPELLAMMRPLVDPKVAEARQQLPDADPYEIAERARLVLAQTLGPVIATLTAPSERGGAP